MTNAGLRGAISTENLPHGDVVPIPTRPLSELRVEIESVGVPKVEVPKLSAWSTAFCRSMRALVVPKEKLPEESIVVVAMPPKYACVAENCVEEAFLPKICRPFQIFAFERLSASV